MTDRDVVERVNALFPAVGGVTERVQTGKGSKPIHEWYIMRGDEITRILNLILPYLGERRTAKAHELLEYIANRPGQGSFERNKTHCPRGHEYTPENTYRAPCGRGGRQCQICIQIRNRAKSRKLSEERRLAKQQLLSG
jgi:hypothetical protein